MTDGDEKSAGPKSSTSQAGELTRFGSRISLVSGVDKDEVDVTFLSTHTLHHVSVAEY